MAQLTGEPKFLQECEPGTLVRVLHRSDSRFALAVAVGNRSPDKVVALDEADGFPLIDLGGAEPVISYGQSYRIRESMKSAAVTMLGRSTPGHIEIRMGNGHRVKHLIAKADRHIAAVDLDTGRLAGQLPGSGFAVMRWSVLLVPENGMTAVEVFSMAEQFE